ncbi:MAG: putative nucleotidyltransferase substrate binding domain-containing protein [Desulfosarcinaceae bacterium]|nr:putative nucleotidyltransferase substrate binding domain-containing protein [Desulfosarcinaceae bacterium]
MSQDAFEYLRNLPHFAMLPEAEVSRIADAAQVRIFKEGTVLAEQGKSRLTEVLVITKGQLSLYNEKRRKGFLSGHIKFREVFGGITILMNGGISLRSVHVDRETHAYAIADTLFLDVCRRFKAFYEYFLENFSHNVFDDSLEALIETGQARRFLAQVDPFSFLPEEVIEKVAPQLSMVHYPKDTVLFMQGRSRVGFFYIIQKGSAERYFEEKNQKTMRGVLTEGDTYGGISILLNDGISVRTLQVREDAYFYALPKQVFLELCDRYPSFTEYFTDTFGKRMLDRSYASIVARTLTPKDDELQVFNQTVANIYKPKAVFCDAEISIQAAADRMRREKSSFLLVREKSGNPIGIVTERDLTRKVIAVGADTQLPVASIMSTPLKTVPRQAMVFEAILDMMKSDIRHLAVTDADGAVVGSLSNREIISAQGQSPLFLLREIIEADAMDDIIARQRQVPGMIRGLITNGANAQNVTRFITTISDAILNKVMAFTLEQLGPAPTRFAFMILGSEGRSEQTLKTDQDNAIVYADDSADAAATEAYFLEYGKIACKRLDEAGYAFCEGDVMAQNPRWCQPIRTWKEYFTSWIRAGQPEDLLQASIFFDFRTGYGDRELVSALRSHLFGSLGGWSGFFRNLTENALHFKPPIGFFRNFVVESKGEHRNAFDIKRAIMPIVDFARIYALHHKIEETNTLERLTQLRLTKVLSHQEFDELEKAYSFLMQLRFVRQVTAAIDENSQPDNYINPKKLTSIEQTTLREIFKRVEKFQSKLSFDFMGMA